MAEEIESLQYNSENKVRQRNIAIIQHIFQKGLCAPPWLKYTETPFKWAYPLQRILMYFLMHRKLEDYKNQTSFYGFEKFSILLVIVLNRVLDYIEAEDDSSEGESKDDDPDNGSIGACGDKTEGCNKNTVRDEEARESREDEEEEGENEFFYGLEEALTRCEQTIEEMASEGDVMYNRIGPVFHHVLQATKSHVLFIEGKRKESKELARNIQKVEDLSQECQAGIEGLKVKFIMSMYQDYRVLFPMLSKAIELDPNCGYWYYLFGKVIRRLRREYHENMVEKELELFEKAVELERNPKFLVYLAQACQEMANQLIYNKESEPVPRETVNSLLEKSVSLFRECWQLKNDSASITRRVGNGMVKMRAGFIDKTVAKEALLKAIAISPKCGYFQLGKYYYYHERNDKKALECFEREAPSNIASPEIIRVNLLKDPDYDPEEVLQAWLNHDQGTLKQHTAECDSGWYYLMYKNDLEKSVKCFWNVLKMDYKSFKVMEYSSYGFFVAFPINMVEVLVNEVLLLKEKNERLPLEERKDMTFLESFLEKVLEKHPDLRNITLKPNLLKELKNTVEDTISFKRRQRYGKYFKKSEYMGKSHGKESWRRNNHTLEYRNQQPYKEQEYDGKWAYNKTPNRENNSEQRRYRLSSGIGDDERRNLEYNRDDGRRHSESQSSWRNLTTSSGREGMTEQSDTNRRYNNGGRSNNRQYNSYNNNRYDVTVTDWRSENRRQ